MHEVWKRQQVHEDARKMYRAEVLVRKLGQWECVTLEVMIWSEEWIGRERSDFGAGNPRAMRGKGWDRN